MESKFQSLSLQSGLLLFRFQTLPLPLPLETSHQVSSLSSHSSKKRKRNEMSCQSCDQEKKEEEEEEECINSNEEVDNDSTQESCFMQAGRARRKAKVRKLNPQGLQYYHHDLTITNSAPTQSLANQECLLVESQPIYYCELCGIDHD